MTDGGAADHGARITQLESRMDSLAKLVSELDEENEQLRAEIRDLRDENELVRRKIDRIEDDTSMLGDIRQGNATDRERRMATILLTLRNDAIESGGSSTMNAKSCHDALNREGDRTSMYDLMEGIPELVESDSVRYINEPRSSPRNSRLEMDKSEGPLPTTFKGHDLTGEEVA